MAQKKASVLWFLLPVFFSLIGGIAGYFIVKHKGDEDRANKIFFLGLAIFIIIPIINFAISETFDNSVLISPFSLLT